MAAANAASARTSDWRACQIQYRASTLHAANGCSTGGPSCFSQGSPFCLLRLLQPGISSWYAFPVGTCHHLVWSVRGGRTVASAAPGVACSQSLLGCARPTTRNLIFIYSHTMTRHNSSTSIRTSYSQLVPTALTTWSNTLTHHTPPWERKGSAK